MRRLLFALRFMHLDADPNATGGGGGTLLSDPPADPPAGDPPAGDPPADPPAGDPPADPPSSDDPPASDPPADPPKKESQVPEKYDLKLPENSPLDDAVLERLAASARERGLSNEQAQSALEFASAEVVRQQEAFLAANRPGGEAWLRNVQEWETAALADPELGGTREKLQQNAQAARLVLEKYFPPEIKEFLNETGYGSHPAILKGLLKISKASAEGELVLPRAQGTGKRDPVEVMYGTSNS